MVFLSFCQPLQHVGTYSYIPWHGWYLVSTLMVALHIIIYCYSHVAWYICSYYNYGIEPLLGYIAGVTVMQCLYNYVRNNNVFFPLHAHDQRTYTHATHTCVFTLHTRAASYGRLLISKF